MLVLVRNVVVGADQVTPCPGTARGWNIIMVHGSTGTCSANVRQVHGVACVVEASLGDALQRCQAGPRRRRGA